MTHRRQRPNPLEGRSQGGENEMARRLKRHSTRAPGGRTASRQKRSGKPKIHYRELQALQEISQAVLTSLDIQTVLERILDKALSIGSVDLVLIRLLDPSSGMLVPVASRGYRDPENVQRHRRETRPGRLRHRAMLSKHTSVVENVQAVEGLRTLKREGVRSAIFVPVHVEEKVL